MALLDGLTQGGADLQSVKKKHLRSAGKRHVLERDGTPAAFPFLFPLKIGDKSCSSPSSSNTLSSSASSSSDDKHFGSGDLADAELLGLTYVKGASTDSGIDTAPCMPPAALGPGHLAGSRPMIHSRAEQWADPADVSGPEDEQAKMFAVHSYAPAMSANGAAAGSMGDLSEISSHSRYVPASTCPCHLATPSPAWWGRGLTRRKSVHRTSAVTYLPSCVTSEDVLVSEV